MRMLGYGEDSLTLRALSDPEHLGRILAGLDDPTPVDDVLVVYRPSFGRAGGPTSPQFGELDAIIATARGVYLVESKWDHAGKTARDIVPLVGVQLSRHAIFAWLRERWSSTYAGNWPAFVRDHRDDFRARFPVRPLPPVNSLLARNLDHLLTTLRKHPLTTTNVLLYFHSEGSRVPTSVTDEAGQPTPTPFRLVGVPYRPEGDSGFIVLRQC